jgi:hypothetical protein
MIDNENHNKASGAVGEMNQVALRLGNDVSLRLFADACTAFREAIETLTRESGAKIDWIITGLETGSPTYAQATGISQDPVAVATVAKEWVGFGQSLRKRELVPSKKLRPAYDHFVDLVDASRPPSKRVDWLLLINDEADVEVVSTAVDSEISDVVFESYDTVVGIITAINDRGGFHFSLSDELYGRSAYCSVVPGPRQEQVLRQIWRKRVMVEGLVKRDPADAHVLQIREIDANRLHILPDPQPGSYRDSLGLSLWEQGDKLPEDIVREMRDA